MKLLLKHWRATLAYVLVCNIVPFVFSTTVVAMSWKRWLLLSLILVIFEWTVRLDWDITSERIGSCDSSN